MYSVKEGGGGGYFPKWKYFLYFVLVFQMKTH